MIPPWTLARGSLQSGEVNVALCYPHLAPASLHLCISDIESSVLPPYPTLFHVSVPLAVRSTWAPRPSLVHFRGSCLTFKTSSTSLQLQIPLYSGLLLVAKVVAKKKSAIMQWNLLRPIWELPWADQSEILRYHVSKFSLFSNEQTMRFHGCLGFTATWGTAV